MSCYEWERGTITIPTKLWSKFRTDLLKAWNEQELRLLEKAKTMHKTLTDACKGKRGTHRAQALKAAVQTRGFRGPEGSTSDRALDMIVTWSGWGEDAVYTLGPLPKKKDLKLCATSKDAEIYDMGYSVMFKNATRSLVWTVDENNHAREHAHEHWFAKLVFTALSRIVWTQGSGGELVGNDEYNQDSGCVGGGGNYVTKTFRAGMSRSRARYQY